MPRGLGRSTRKWRELARSNGQDCAATDPTAAAPPDRVEAVLRRAFDLPATGGIAVRVVQGPSPGSVSVSVELSDALTKLVWELCGGVAVRERVEKVVCGLLNEGMRKGRLPYAGCLAETVAWLRELAAAPCNPDLTAGSWWELILNARRLLFVPVQRTVEGSDEVPYARKCREFLCGNSSVLANASEKTAIQENKCCSPTKSCIQDQCDYANELREATVLVHQPRRRSERSLGLLKFGESDVLRKRVPIGPFFQADVPDWTVQPNRNKVSDDDQTCESRWLGTRLWPIEDDNCESNLVCIGRGRTGSCSCFSPSSTTCIRHHVTMARIQLKRELAHAFMDMGFDNMGEEVAKSWSWDQQRIFSTIVRLNPISEFKTFWYHALRSFPSKTSHDIASYYFNVHVPRRMSLQTKFPSESVDSDDDEWSGQVEEAQSPIYF